MIAIIDYDAGNTFNVQKALQYIGLDAVLTADRDTILAADGVILPGVVKVPAIPRLSILSFNSKTNRSEDFLPMPGNFCSPFVSPLMMSPTNCSGLMADRMPRPSFGPTPDTEMSNKNSS